MITGRLMMGGALGRGSGARRGVGRWMRFCGCWRGGRDRRALPVDFARGKTASPAQPPSGHRAPCSSEAGAAFCGAGVVGRAAMGVVRR